jgi:hypothetical protein
MTTSGTGSAREIAPGRLSNFEDVPDVEEAPTPLLPPRRPSKSTSARTSTNRTRKSTERPVRAGEPATSRSRGRSALGRLPRPLRGR